MLPPLRLLLLELLLLLHVPVLVTGRGSGGLERDEGGGEGEQQIWFSQHMQDRLLMEQIYPDLRGGYFVELGASDGVTTLERSFNWHGLCIEPSLSYRDLLLSGRRCVKRGDVVSGRSGDIVTFVDQADDKEEKKRGEEFKQTQTQTQSPTDEQAQTVTHMNLDIDTQRVRATSSQRQSSGAGVMRAPPSSAGLYSGILQDMQSYEVEGVFVQRVTRTLADLLDEVGAPSHVDFLSLDTEGSEYDILSTFPFHRRTFGAMLIEHNFEEKKRHATNLLLESKGYIRVRCILTDDLYVALRLVSHYQIRADPRTCEAISFQVKCSEELNSPAGRKECSTTGGLPDQYFHFPGEDEVEPWQRDHLAILQQTPAAVCSSFLGLCDQRNGWKGTEIIEGTGRVSTKLAESFMVPMSSGLFGPLLKLHFASGPPLYHRFSSTLSAIEDVKLPELCIAHSLPPDECADIGQKVEEFVDDWLVTSTREAVLRVAEGMLAGWAGGLDDDKQQ